MKKLSKAKFNKMMFVCNYPPCGKILDAKSLVRREEDNRMVCTCDRHSNAYGIELGTYNKVWQDDRGKYAISG